jgi:hypothetical protein
MSTVNSKLAALIAKLQDRLNRVGLQSGQTAAAVLTLRDETRLRTGTLAEDVVKLKTLADDTVTIIKTREQVADKREAAQTLRDQNNVQAIINFRDSTAKAFAQVSDDVAKLDRADHKLSDRVTEVEKFTSDLVERAKNLVRMPAPAPPSLPSDHVWVNKKLTGVYDTTTNLEERLAKLESFIARLLTNGNPAPSAKPRASVNYCGFAVRFRGNKLLLEDEKEFDIFTVSEPYTEIANVEQKSFGLEITMKRGDRFVLSGGPNLGSMYLYLAVKA